QGVNPALVHTNRVVYADKISNPSTRFPPFFFFSMIPRPPRSPLFPYTTLFRSRPCAHRQCHRRLLSFARRHRLARPVVRRQRSRSEEHTSELQSPYDLVCRLLLEKKKQVLDATPPRPVNCRPLEHGAELVSHSA